MRETSNPDMCPGSLNEEAGRGWLALPKLRAWLRLHPPPSAPFPLTSPSPTNKPLTLSLSPGEPQGPCDLTGRNPPRFSSNRFFSSARHSDQINRPLLPGENVSTGPICLSDGLREGRQGSTCVCHVQLPLHPLPPFPGRVSPTWDGCPAGGETTGRAGAGVSAAGGLAGGCVHTAAHCALTAQAAGGTLEGLHATLPLDVQVLEPPALPGLPKLHLDLPWEKEGRKSHHANQLPTIWPHYYITGKRKNPPHYIKRHKSRPPGA